MLKVDSRKTLNLITLRFLRESRGRNLVAGLAVILTTVMFTSLFTATVSMMKSTALQEIRMSENNSYITAVNLTEETAARAAAFPAAERAGKSVFIAMAENDPLLGGDTELNCADENGARAMNLEPESGRLPRGADEAAMSEITLDVLGIPHRLGSAVELEYTLSGKRQKKTFTLCGIWKGDSLAASQHILVSEAFCRENGVKATEESLKAGNPEGACTLYLWSGGIFSLCGDLEELKTDFDFQKTGGDIYINSAYDYFSEDAFRGDLICVILAVIFAAGYLIIYNVFRLSVGSDIRIYALLKNIGMTGRQLKVLVLRQAAVLAAAGIPAGLLAGWFAGRAMTPLMLQGQQEAGAETVYSANPLIFAAAALLSALTIYLGCQLPCRAVLRITPVEAVKMQTEEPGRVKADRRARAKNRRRRGFTPAAMAMANLRRAPKKAVLVVLSLTLPLILLNSAYSISRSFDYDLFLGSYCSFDFEVSGLNPSRSTSYFDAVTPDFVREASGRGEVEKLALIYNQDIDYELDQAGYENMKTILDKAEAADYPVDLEKEWAYLKGRALKTHVMGLNRQAFEKMEFAGKAPSYEEFAGGEYVIINDRVEGFGNLYETGDRITFGLGGEEKTYEVLTAGYMPYDLSYRFGIIETAFDNTFYLPVSEYHALGGGENAMLAGLDIEDGKEKVFSDWLSGYVEKAEKNLYVESRMETLAEAEAFSRQYYVVTGLLSAVLFIIGILNFFNAVSVDLMSRRKELSLLEAVGMTGSQIRRMLSLEGLFYGVLAVLLADTVGMALAGPVIKDTVGRVFYFDYAPGIAAATAALPALALIAAGIPLYYYRRIKREPLRERLV